MQQTNNEAFFSISLEAPRVKKSITEHQDFVARNRMYPAKASYTFFWLELKLENPPLDFILFIHYNPKESNEFKTVSIQVVKYYDRFIYRGGFYLLDLRNIPELSEVGHPLWAEYENPTGPNTTNHVKISYKVETQNIN